jgi:hypothetical protein
MHGKVERCSPDVFYAVYDVPEKLADTDDFHNASFTLWCLCRLFSFECGSGTDSLHGSLQSTNSNRKLVPLAVSSAGSP